MNLPEYSLRNSKVIYFFLAVMLLGGIRSFTTLGKKEDAPFVIKSAVLVTTYPGATPQEVEQLITEPIEREVQSMRNIYKITSESYYGLSKILVELLPSTPSRDIPQLWDELRRKTIGVQPRLPAGASVINVADDFGDVYGIYYGLSAVDGYSYEELRRWAQQIKREVVTIDGVQKVTLFGEQAPVVNIFMSVATLSNLSLKPEEVIDVLSRQNTLVGTGEKQAGAMQIRILESGTYQSLEDIADQLLTSPQGRQIRLGDVARIERGYAEPPANLMLINGRKGIGIGISTAPDKDVVKTGKAISERLSQLMARVPVGIELATLYPEDRIAEQANNVFILNLLESVGIVILVIMLAMGFRAGILIGSSLLFSIGGTLLLMQFIGQGLNRTSLAGFIIAMGMLVDNAIVVTDNARGNMLRGMGRTESLIRGAVGPQWGLFGATLIAVCSFLPLYLAPSSVAEIVKPLFVVLAISLGLSWLLALTQTPLFGSFILRPVQPGKKKEPYSGRFYRIFDRTLNALIRFRWATVAVVLLLFAGAVAAMRVMPQNFFPNLDKPYFRADCFLPNGYDIRDTEREMRRIGAWLGAQPSVRNVSVAIGSSPPRYYLASSSFGPRPNFANILVETYTKDSAAALEARFSDYVGRNHPDVLLRSSLFKLSPAVEAAIEFGFVGEQIDTLVALTNRAEAIMAADARTTGVRNSWGNKIPTWTPLYSQQKGLRMGITRAAVARELTVATTGYRLGEYREGDQFMPILLKDENIADYNLSNLRTLPVYTPGGKVLPLEQTVDGFRFDYTFDVIERYNRQRVMKAQCDPAEGVNTKALFADLNARIRDSVPLPEGYSLQIFGEQESQEQSNQALAANMPLTFILIFIILLLLFKGFKKPVVILLMIPLIFIGVMLGLLVTGKMFDFFALLGLLGLVGMNVKNAIVLVEQIGVESRSGKGRREAVLAATRSRVVPVAVASGTTILGMIPLLGDSMFGGMAATIMGGLFVATFLTILVLPVTYLLFFGLKDKPAAHEA